MVEREPDAGDVGQVGRDVAGAHVDLAVLHVLGVDEEDVVEQPELLQQRGAHEAVEVGAGDEAVGGGGGSVYDHAGPIGIRRHLLSASRQPPPRAEEGQDREHAAVVVVGRGQVELGEDVRDVLLDRARRDDEGAGDRGVGLALRHQPEHLVLARGERGERPVVAVAARLHELGDDLAVERGPAGRDPAQRVEEGGDVADALLEQIADPALAGGQQLARVDRLDVLGEDQDADVGVALARLDRRAHALVGERGREAHVDDREVGLVAADDAQQARAVVGLRDDVDVVLAQQGDDPGAQQRLVLGDHDPHGSSARIVVGPPGGLVIVSVPSSASTRCSQPGQAAALRVGAARPVVGDLDHEQVRVQVELDARARVAGVLGDVGERLGDHEVGRRLDHRGRAAIDVGVDGDVGRHAPAERVDGGGEPAGDEHRRRDPAREVAQLGDRRARLAARLADEVGELGLVGQPRLGAAELHAQGHEPRLRAVVEVALDPAQLRVLHVERPAARARELVDALDELLLADPRQPVAVHEQRARRQPQRHAEDRPHRPQVAAAGERPHHDADHGDDRAQVDADAEAADRVALRAQGAEDERVRRDRDGQAEPDPDGPVVPAGGEAPDQRAGEPGERRERDVQGQRAAVIARRGGPPRARPARRRPARRRARPAVPRRGRPRRAPSRAGARS